MYPEPFVKWVGSKRQVLPELLKHVPEKFGRYHEPMVGGGAFYWGLVRAGVLSGKRVFLSDLDRDLIDSYTLIRNNHEELLGSLRPFVNRYKKLGGKLFYQVRDAWNKGVRSPARFIFLKQTSFNGLWRYNQKGQLNMSWGKYDAPRILDVENIRACSRALQKALLKQIDYRNHRRYMMTGDLVYYDPPYWGRFNKYGPCVFSQSDHIDLVKLCSELQARGVHVIYSNEDARAVRKILNRYWPEGKRSKVFSRRHINCDGDGRQPVADLIVSSHGEKG
jgi:DNA adenine methylase